MGTDEQGALYGVHNQVLAQVVTLTNICLIYNLYTTILHTTMEMHAGFCKQHTSYFASSKHSELQHFMIDS